MKRFVLSFALGAVLSFSAFASAHAASDPTPASDAKQPKLFHISTIRGAQAVRDFEHNVQVMQSERQAAVDLQTAVQKETDPKKKKELQTKLDAQMKKLNEDNAVMTKTYGFSLTRNYSVEVEAVNIYLQVSDEEAARIEQQQKQAQAQKSK